MTTSFRYRVALVAITSVAVMALWSACGGDPAGTGPSPTGPPSVTCPANLSIGSAPGGGEAVTYTAPVVTGGTPPVSTTCTPGSGSTFPLGTTAVGCTAKDAINRTAVCSFSVSLTSSTLGAMSFVAFGDSITAGQNGIEPNPPGEPDNYTPACDSISVAAKRRLQAIRPAWIDLPNSYPTQLLGLLTARFGAEAFTMDNEGLPGETALDGAQRLETGCSGVSVFTRDHPNVFMLLEGVNDIGGDSWQPTTAEEQTIIGYLRSDVSNAVAAKVPFVFVSTILPVKECPVESTQACRVGNYGDPTVPNEANASIDQINELIRAGMPGAIIVDGNSAFKVADPTLSSLLGDDGLHPTPAGYGVLARAFMNAITAHIPITSLRRARR